MLNKNVPIISKNGRGYFPNQRKGAWSLFEAIAVQLLAFNTTPKVAKGADDSESKRFSVGNKQHKQVAPKLRQNLQFDRGLVACVTLLSFAMFWISYLGRITPGVETYVKMVLYILIQVPLMLHGIYGFCYPCIKPNSLISKTFVVLGRVLCVYWILAYPVYKVQDNFHAQRYAELFSPKFTEMHDYWAISHPEKTNNIMDLFVERAAKVSLYFDAYSRDDFLVEKSKCVMYDYFEKNKIPYSNVLERFSNAKDFWNHIEAREDFPVVVKFCHLTQGSQAMRGPLVAHEIRGNTFFLTKDKVHDSGFRSWINHGVNLVAADPGRPWSEHMERPLASIPVGLLLQEPWELFPGRTRPLEMKISVLWGRAYIGRFENVLDGHAKAIVLPLTSMTPFDQAPWPFAYSNAFPNIPDIETHVKHAIELAERDAMVLRMEFIRVDVFLNPKDPTKPVINEHSIFEMPNYLGEHSTQIAKLWKRGYFRKDFKRILYDVKSYDMTSDKMTIQTDLDENQYM